MQGRSTHVVRPLQALPETMGTVSHRREGPQRAESMPRLSSQVTAAPYRSGGGGFAGAGTSLDIVPGEGYQRRDRNVIVSLCPVDRAPRGGRLLHWVTVSGGFFLSGASW